MERALGQYWTQPEACTRINWQDLWPRTPRRPMRAGVDHRSQWTIGRTTWRSGPLSPVRERLRRQRKTRTTSSRNQSPHPQRHWWSPAICTEKFKVNGTVNETTLTSHSRSSLVENAPANTPSEVHSLACLLLLVMFAVTFLVYNHYTNPQSSFFFHSPSIRS